MEFICDFSNKGRVNRKIVWLADGEAVTQKVLSSFMGADTISLLWPSTGTHQITAVITDDAGSIWSGRLNATVVPDLPEADAGRDTVVRRDAPVTLKGKARDRFGKIVKWEWDIGNVGIFRESPDGSVTFNAGSPSSGVICVLKVTDDDGMTSSDVVKLQVSPWLPFAPMLSPRSAPAIAQAAGRIYALGGTKEALPTMEAYDPASEKWFEQPSLPVPVSGFGTATLDGNIFAVGGLIRDTSGVVPKTVSSQALLMFDPSSARWTIKAPMPAPVRNATAIAFAGKLFVFDLAYQTANPYAYDPASDQWSARNSIPQNALGPFYLQQGSLFLMPSGPASPEIWRYDAAGDAWTLESRNDLAEKTWIPPAMKGKLYREAGGLQVFDDSAGTWKFVPFDMPQPRFGFSVAVFGDAVMVLGGTVSVNQPTGGTSYLETATVMLYKP